MARPKGQARKSIVVTPSRTTKIPLNDDTAEKAKRLKERSLLHSIQKQKMMAAASPGTRRQTIGSEASPKTPRNIGMARSAEGVIDAVTPLRKVPILANFEEWMKMATDNKINATNSWNFALIDYFHDMSLLKEGDSVNFQKASCTLDGCVKIYTSRVDSVATETGKLLSGLANSTNSKKKGRSSDEDGAEGSDEEEGDGDGDGKRKPKRRTQRSSETTLAKDFTQLQVKKLELEFSVDPLFKKASADFDEGGAKGLLLNHLSIDSNGRIVFDSSDDKDGEESIGDDEVETEVEEQEPPDEPAQIANKLASLRNRFFPDLSKLDNQDICPSLKNFDLNTGGTLDIPFLKTLEEPHDEKESVTNENNDNRNDMAFGFDDGYGIGIDDDDMTMAFGEGGEAWANETIADAADRLLSLSKRPPLGFGGPADKEGDFDHDGSRNFSVGFGGGHEDILSYFDEALKKNWAGPEHWRIRRIKDSSKPSIAAVRARKEKETFEIDFMNPSADPPEEMLAQPKMPHTIVIPKKDRISKTRNLLPDDKHFNSRQLIRLFLKPKASVSKRKQINTGEPINEPENLDEEFWAKENMAGEIQASSTPDPKANYDANFFNDDNLDLPVGLDDDDDDAFADAREAFSPGVDGADNIGRILDEAVPMSQITASQAIDFGAQLVTQSRRVRPEYVQYARVAKKVDVRKLKENIWSGLKFEGSLSQVPQFAPELSPAPKFEEPRKFTQVINDLRGVYAEKTMSDISTSYCFICLLHLANEKGLVVEEEGGKLQELVIRKDPSANEADAY